MCYWYENRDLQSNILVALGVIVKRNKHIRDVAIIEVNFQTVSAACFASPNSAAISTYCTRNLHLIFGLKTDFMKRVKPQV